MESEEDTLPSVSDSPGPAWAPGMIASILGGAVTVGDPGGSLCGAPHDGQKRLASGTSALHEGHVSIER
jgi:hypothetical protein